MLCTGQLSSQLCCTAPKPGLSTGDTSASCINSTFDACEGCYTSVGKTRCQTPRSSKEPSYQASSQCSASPRYDGLDMCQECQTLGYLSSCSMGSSAKAQEQLGGQRKRYKDNLKASLKSFSIPLESWETLAASRDNWRSSVAVGAKSAENTRNKAAETKRAARKERAVSTTDTVLSHMCSHCGRGFRARIGLISHLRTHSHSN